MEQQGWVKFYREWLDNPIITKDSEHLAVWTYLNCSATHTEMECIFNNEKITLKAGQMILKQCDMAEYLKIDRFKVLRILKCFENAHLITHITDKRKTLITLEPWAVYQGLNTQPNALPLHVQCTSNQETENEKEKRSKREKDKEKEINKNEKNERIYIPPYIPPLGEMDGNAPFSLSEKHGQGTGACPQDLFEEFWKAYPKKIGKGYAFECFKKIRVSRSLLDTMLEAIAKQKKSDMWKRDKCQYIPNPSTWLNQKRWEDDLGGDTEDDGQIPWSKFNLGIVL